MNAPVVSLEPGMDARTLIQALIVVVVGGLGTLRGAFWGSLLIGEADTFGRALLPDYALFSIYVIMLVTRWIRKVGLENLYRRNVEKAAKIYAAIDGSGGFYAGTASRESRSDMNVTFRLPSEAQEEAFVKEASKLGMKGLKGHRSVGGIRASIYNAFPVAGVDALVAFMKDFARKNG